MMRHTLAKSVSFVGVLQDAADVLAVDAVPVGPPLAFFFKGPFSPDAIFVFVTNVAQATVQQILKKSY